MSIQWRNQSSMERTVTINFENEILKELKFKTTESSPPQFHPLSQDRSSLNRAWWHQWDRGRLCHLISRNPEIPWCYWSYRQPEVWNWPIVRSLSPPKYFLVCRPKMSESIMCKISSTAISEPMSESRSRHWDLVRRCPLARNSSACPTLQRNYSSPASP